MHAELLLPAATSPTFPESSATLRVDFCLNLFELGHHHGARRTMPRMSTGPEVAREDPRVRRPPGGPPVTGAVAGGAHGSAAGRARAVLFDRDGTLVHDVPYNGDPALVRPVDGAREALDRLRSAGLRLGLVTNQSGVARGLITLDDVHAVHEELQRLLGPLDTVAVCPHGPGDGCTCRKPAPGLVLTAAHALGLQPQQTVVVGDIGADMGAASAAGARAVLVPTPVTRREEVEAAPVVAPDLATAVDLVLRGLA